MLMLDVDMDELFMKVNYKDQLKFLKKKIQTEINMDYKDYLNYYPFNETWIIKQKFNWQNNTIIKCNKSRDQFILVNQSIDPNEDKNKQRRFKKRFELLLQILVGKSDLQSLCGWSLWSFALGQQGDMDSDDLYSSSEDGDEDESSGDARCSSSSFSSSSLSSSSSCSVLSLHVPSTNYHYVDANIWSF